MLENIRKIRAIDYTDITKIPNYIDEVVETAIEIWEKPGYFYRESGLENIIKNSMDVVAFDYFSEEEREKYYKDREMENEKLSKIRIEDYGYIEM